MTINPLIKVTLILFFLSQSCENKKAKKNLTLQPEIEGMVWIPGGFLRWVPPPMMSWHYLMKNPNTLS